MADALVGTKLLPPRPRRDAVPRTRLSGPLERAEEAAVTLVSAPAGFGKTTLVASWLAGDDRPVAWVSLDERDRRPASFWAYVLAALDRAVPGAAAAALTLVQSGQAPVETALAAVVNELSVHDGDVVLVLDDYHLADGPDVADGMSFLVDHLPPQLHLVITTRADPALPLSRLRARGQLVEVRAADLRFDADEVTAYLNGLHDLALPADAVAALAARTEGWVAALQLAVLSLQGRADAPGFVDRFAGDDRFVVDYLVDEVLSRQPDDVRRFLLDTAVLDRLTAPLCEAVTDSADGSGRAMLDLLDRENLFLVPLDDQRRWYRYHHLFADVLRVHLLQDGPERAAGRHRRASSWFAEHGETEEAVRHALAAGDGARAAELVELAIPDLRRERREDVLRRWLDVLPPEVVQDRPVLATGLAGALMASNEFGDVARRVAQVEEVLARPAAEQVVVDHAELARVPATLEIYRAGLCLVAGDPAATIERAGRALALAPEDDDLARGAASGLAGLAAWASGDVVAAHRSYVAAAEALTRTGHIADVLGCSLTIADMELALGRLGDAARTIEGALDLARRHQPDPATPMRGTADMLVALSRTAWHRDDLRTSADLLGRADDLGESADLPQNPYRWRVAMARLRAAERDWPTALELLDEAERVYVGDFSPQVHPVHATRARLLATSGDVAGATAWARRHGLDADDELSYLREYEHVTLARVLLAQHRSTGSAATLSRAAGLLDRLLEAALAGDRYGTVIEVQVLRAVASSAAGERKTALAALEQAVDLAEPDGWTRFLLDAGPGLTDLLGDLAARRPASAFLQGLVTDRTAGPDAVAAPPTTLVDPLSDRELDVLRLLGSDLDGPAIARELVVSLNTVRTHTKHIYTKLDVNNRRAAVSRAHQLGLLSRSGRA
ncbi:LuxR C-terminal-related transcriptional regulator [Nocardioides sp.]|uniref:LuxR C-terminal-related transcriptional regulator n=1 Tax=Nocardioides sp. TaxID=35761 RepID=UPI003783028B